MAVATAMEEEGSALAKMVPMAVEDSAAGAAAAAGPSTAGEPRGLSLEEYRLECLRLDSEEEECLEE